MSVCCHVISTFAVFFTCTPLLTGCPDAVRAAPETANPVADGSGSPPDAGNSSPDAPIGSPDAATLRTNEKLGAVSGQIAVGANDVFVNTGSSLVALPKTPGMMRIVSLVAAGRAIVVDGVHIYYTETQAQHTTLFESLYDGSKRRSLRSELLAEPELGVSGTSLLWCQPDDGLVVSYDRNGGQFPPLFDASRDTGHSPVHLVAFQNDVVLILAPAKDGTQRVIARSKAGSGSPTIELGLARSALWLGADEGVVYFMNEGLGILTVSLDGHDGGPSPPSISGDPSWFDLGVGVVDTNYVYWASHTQGSVFRASKASGIAEVFAKGFIFPAQRPGAVRPQDEPRRTLLGIDAQFVYVSDATGVYRVAK